MNVLVTGGTGFVGTRIARELIAGGHQVHLLSRKAGRARKAAPEFAASFRNGNVLDVESLKPACTGMDAVIHLVGIISEVGDQTFENVHTRGTENIVAAARHAGIRRFIHMSALGARPDAVARYQSSKWAAEEIVRRSGLDWTIFRPSIIYGPGDGFVNLFARISRFSPVVPVIGNGRTRFAPVPVEAVARAFARATGEPRAVGAALDLCGREVFTLDEIVGIILAITRRKRLLIHIPAGVARLQALVLEFLFAKILRKAPPLNRDQIAMLQEDNSGDSEPAAALFQLAPISFRDGIARFLRPGG